MNYSFLPILTGLSLLLTACDKPLFSLLPADETGITFSNRIVDNDTMNIIDFEYIYNGGGTAIGDFNNDGLSDVFFTGNQVANRLYLNKGEFKFEDITQKAGVGGNGKWCSGVALVDINNDGWLDIYVGATVSKVAAKRENLLFVNQGAKNGQPPVFREMAKEYGIADDGHTTNAAFFDYDNDGDLDLYVLTNTIENYPNAYHDKVKDGSSPTTDRLYRNDPNPTLGHPVFTNVSKEANILTEGYGLGLNITDINRDGWKDIYVTNDYLSDDLLYINNHDGTFTDQAGQYFKHTSSSAMGNDVADINNDGLVDVVAVDMLPRDNYRKKMLVGPNNYQTYLNNEQYKFNYQYVRNTLQLNQGPVPTVAGGVHPVFSDISLFSDVAETDWSWTPTLLDFDHDGYRDLLITNGFPKDITDRDFVSFRAESATVATKSFMLEQIPIIKISNYAFRNKGGDKAGDLGFEDVTEKWGLKTPSFSNGAAYGDLDNDGDVDYVVNNINDSAFVYRNNLVESKRAKANYLRVKFVGPAQNRMGLGATVELHYGNQKQVYEHTPYRGYLSTVEPVAHFGLGATATINEVRIIWPGLNGQPQRQQVLRNVKPNQVLTADVRNAREPVAPASAPKSLFTEVTDSLKIAYQHSELEYIDFNVQKLLPHKLSQFGPAVSVGDVNGDGLDDMFVGGSKFNKGHFLLQTAAGAFVEKDLLPGEAVPGPYGGTAKDKIQEDMGTLLFDADGDGDLDLYVASGSIEGDPSAPIATGPVFQDRLYLNDGKGGLSLAQNALPANSVSKSCVKAADIDRDGDLDLFVGGRVEPDHYPKPVSSFVLRNDSRPGQPRFTDVTKTLAPALQDIGLVCDALWTDPDNDGWPDLMLAGEFMPLTLLKNQQGKLQAAKDQLSEQKGWWNSLVAGDFDRDGDIDYIAGNLGQNARMRASKEEPVRVYAGDFDNNGFYDAIPTIFIPDEKGNRREFTFHGRDDLIKQMISMRKRFPLYKDFTQASIDKLLTDEEREKALVLEANYFQSAYVENKGNGKFELHPLPTPAQMAPIFGMVANDVDRDGNLDVMLVGNDYGGEVLMGRYDALNGLWLRGDGKGGFTAQTTAASGFYVPGNAKGLAQLTDASGRELLVATQNRGRLCVFRNNQPAPSVRLRSTDVSALLTFKDGKTQKVEFSYGNSFLSQSARTLLVSPQVKGIEITDSKGHKRPALNEATLTRR
ncbi:VCBS repeat-containing protein [Spirosoma taeanense]|uniref:VCBS repeat-containing protein n=1 Tax=Spirosoma taeanense TaxID=2735870 RepID=A0A6M5YB43_9BACT|nr:FG-GAP-like repeat-containing protein [Spirosoma taeanense]QJW90461.1 VCBS repeat-containing protein [Spirosoma taeanense]